MLVEIIKDEKGYAVGWSMKGENPEEIRKLGTIRDLQYWGINEYAIKYDGRKDGDDATNNPGTLSWVQKGYADAKEKRLNEERQARVEARRKDVEN